MSRPLDTSITLRPVDPEPANHYASYRADICRCGPWCSTGCSYGASHHQTLHTKQRGQSQHTSLWGGCTRVYGESCLEVLLCIVIIAVPGTGSVNICRGAGAPAPPLTGRPRGACFGCGWVGEGLDGLHGALPCGPGPRPSQLQRAIPLPAPEAWVRAHTGGPCSALRQRLSLPRARHRQAQACEWRG